MTEVRKIGEVTNQQLLDEMIKKQPFSVYHLTDEIKHLVLSGQLEMLVMAVRAEIDWRSDWPAISTWDDMSGDTASNIIRAFKELGFVLDEEFPSNCIRAFLGQVIVQDPGFGSVQEYESRVPYSRERVGAFYDVINSVLDSYEKTVLINIVTGVRSLDDMPANDDGTSAKLAYARAQCKLRGDHKELARLRLSHSVELKEATACRNAFAALERIYWYPRGPWVL